MTEYFNLKVIIACGLAICISFIVCVASIYWFWQTWLVFSLFITGINLKSPLNIKETSFRILVLMFWPVFAYFVNKQNDWLLISIFWILIALSVWYSAYAPMLDRLRKL